MSFSLFLKPNRTGIIANHMKISLRYAGGGGRPGGKPTFNWKERKALRLAGKNTKPFKMKKVGDDEDLEELLQHIDTSKTIDLLSQDDGYEFNEADVDPNKIISMNVLFGPNKPRGRILKKKNYDNKRFSHTRMFGAPKQFKITE